MKKKLIKVARNPKLLVFYILNRDIFRFIPDRLFLKIKYRFRIGKKLDFKKPKTFNEKLQWLKVYNRDPRYTKLVDKYKVRGYIADILGREYLIPLLGVYNNYSDIDFDELPNKFALKPNHTSGNVFICLNKPEVDFKELERKVSMWLKRRYYWIHREWPYKNINPKIICEKYMVDEFGAGLRDYKLMCFNGEPKIIQVMSERKNGAFLLNHFDLDWNELDIPRKTVRRNPNVPPRPKHLGEMIEISRKLSKNIPFVRVDLYDTEQGVYFGEMTFYPVSGFMDFANEEHDYLWGSWIRLPHKA